MPLEVKLKPVTTTTIKKLPGEAMLERKMGPAVEKWEHYASMILLEWKPTWCLGGRNPRKRFSRENALPWKLSNGLDSE